MARVIAEYPSESRISAGMPMDRITSASSLADAAETIG